MMAERTYAPSDPEYTDLLDSLGKSCLAMQTNDDACHALVEIADEHLYASATRAALVDQLGALCSAGKTALCGRQKDLRDAP